MEQKESPILLCPFIKLNHIQNSILVPTDHTSAVLHCTWKASSLYTQTVKLCRKRISGNTV